jgi:hypothetical protein
VAWTKIFFAVQAIFQKMLDLESAIRMEVNKWQLIDSVILWLFQATLKVILYLGRWRWTFIYFVILEGHSVV